jgi:hypothetical protein
MPVFIGCCKNLFSDLAQSVANKQQNPQRNAGVSLTNRQSGQSSLLTQLPKRPAR